MYFTQYAICTTHDEIAMGTDERLFERLNKLRDSATVIVGIGNILKGDDGAGPLVCEQLTGKVCAELIDAGTVPENYIQPIIKKAPRNLLIIDAIDFGAPAGTINIFKPEQLNSSVFSTHTLSPRLFADMVCRNIKGVPQTRNSAGTPFCETMQNGNPFEGPNVDVYFVGIQPGQTQLGQSISPGVGRAIRRLVRVLTEIFPLGE